MNTNNSVDIQSAIASFESSAINFGIRFIPDSMVRVEYNLKAKKFSAEIMAQIKSGKISNLEGATRASELRNVLMDSMRGKSSEIGRAYAVSQKTNGKSLLELESKYAKKLFEQPFDKLKPTQQNQIWKEIVFSSGRARLKANQLAKKMGSIGRSFIVLTIAISVYNISTSDDKIMATAKEGAVIGGGLLGSVAGGAAAGLACGPGAPVCVGIGIFIGGVMFAVGAEMTFDSFWN